MFMRHRSLSLPASLFCSIIYFPFQSIRILNLFIVISRANDFPIFIPFMEENFVEYNNETKESRCVRYTLTIHHTFTCQHSTTNITTEREQIKWKAYRAYSHSQLLIRASTFHSIKFLSHTNGFLLLSLAMLESNDFSCIINRSIGLHSSALQLIWCNNGASLQQKHAHSHTYTRTAAVWHTQLALQKYKPKS